MINPINSNIISEDDVTGQYQAFGPTPDPVGTIPTGCTVCSTSCMGNCSGDCMGGCGDANCEGQCSLTCESSCSADCTNTCMETCSGGCNQECVNGCREMCTSGCSGACQGCTGCSGSCIDACVNGCKHSCMNVSTTSGTHVIVPDWPTTGQIDDEELAELLRVIKSYLDELMKYDYKRISELDEAVVVHENDTLVGQIIVEDGTVIDVGELNLSSLNLVISDFDNQTVKITAASLVEFLKLNYKNYWVWTPYVEEDQSGNKVKISWQFHSSFEPTAPESINLADLVSGGVGRVTDDTDGLMPHELFTKLNGKDFVSHESLTGKTIDGSAAPSGTSVIRLAVNYHGNTDNINVFNEDLLGDLDARYAPNQTYVSESAFNDYKAEVTLSISAITTDLSEHYSTSTQIAEVYLTSADAATIYETIANVNAIKARVTTNETNIATLNAKTDTSDNSQTGQFYSKTQSDARYVQRGEPARTQVPTRVANVSGTGGKAGLMQPGDVDAIASATALAEAASSDVSALNTRVAAAEGDIASLYAGQSYATTNYSTGVASSGVVTIPATSAIKVGTNGAIDLKKFQVNNLIKNSTFVNGFNAEWFINNNIDMDASNVTTDSTIGATVAKVAIIADGQITQSFYTNMRGGIKVTILFKQNASATKIIEVKIDNTAYVNHTVPVGNGYYLAEFFFNISDNDTFANHVLTLHNPDTSNTVAFEIVNIMVQKGNMYTGWHMNSQDPINNSVNILTFDNYLKFQDLPDKYTEDVYADDTVTLLHRAGEYINPSSSVVMHKNTSYLLMQLTAARTIDGNLRTDTIPLRVDLLTGECNISGNAVSAGILKDPNDPSIVLAPHVAEINGLFDGTKTAFARANLLYDFFDDSVPYVDRNAPKNAIQFYRIDRFDSDVLLGSATIVGAFTNNLKNGEVFNDYYYNNASGDFSHAENSMTEASGNYSHAQGLGTYASADCQDVSGKYNIVDSNMLYAVIVGNGVDNTHRSNAYTLDWSGNATFAGTITASGILYPDNASPAIQYSTMPTASASTVDKIVQYIGTTTNDYTKGCFYIGVNNNGTYSWQLRHTDLIASTNNDGLMTSTMVSTLNTINSNYLDTTTAALTYLTIANASTTYEAKSDVVFATNAEIDAIFA